MLGGGGADGRRPALIVVDSLGFLLAPMLTLRVPQGYVVAMALGSALRAAAAELGAAVLARARPPSPAHLKLQAQTRRAWPR